MEEQSTLLEKELVYGHTNGTPCLRDNISMLYDGAERANVLATSGSAEANEESSSSNSSGKSSSNSSSKSSSVGGMRQYGQIKASGKCGDLLGDENILFPVEYQSAPIYTILKSSQYATAKNALKNYIE